MDFLIAEKLYELKENNLFMKNIESKKFCGY